MATAFKHFGASRLQFHDIRLSGTIDVDDVAVLCWLEVELLDDEDQIVADEPYRIHLPDGSIREGRLNDKGYVRLDNIPCGECVVQFPNIDEQEMELRGSYEAGKTDWIEIFLEDEDKQPLSKEPYEIELPDGSVRKGSLDGEGRARIDGIKPGNCTVRFPNIDMHDFVEG